MRVVIAEDLALLRDGLTRILEAYDFTVVAAVDNGPSVLPALLTGFSLAFARALGEYGSVVFISGNMPLKTEITSLLIITKLEQYDYAGATAIATMMLVASFAVLFFINALQWWFGRKLRGVV